MSSALKRPSTTCPSGFTEPFEDCFAPFRYCPVKGCGRAEGGVQLPTEGKPRFDYPATFEERLNKIAEMHSKQVGAGGTTSGDCNECGWSWPCPTYRWASELVGPDCTWDLRECSFEDHDHETLRADAAGEPPVDKGSDPTGGAS